MSELHNRLRMVALLTARLLGSQPNVGAAVAPRVTDLVRQHRAVGLGPKVYVEPGVYGQAALLGVHVDLPQV